MSMTSMMRAPTLKMSDNQYVEKATEIVSFLFRHPALNGLLMHVTTPVCEGDERAYMNIVISNSKRRAIVTFSAISPDGVRQFDGVSLRFLVNDDLSISAEAVVGMNDLVVLAPQPTDEAYAEAFDRLAKLVSRQTQPGELPIILLR